MERSRIGIIGCGNIAPVYVATLKALGWIDVAAFADGQADRSESFARKHGGQALAVDALLADASIDAVVNLTPAAAHASVSRRIIESGKATFSEKPLGIDFEKGRALVELANQKGVRLGCAPDTFLGAGLQAARTAVDRGMIGTPIAANAFMLGFGPEWWHPNPEIFYTAGAGPLFDMGPYYFTALVALLGPAVSIIGSATSNNAERVIHATGRVGETFTATAPTHVSSIVEFGGGVSATLVTSFDVKATNYRNIEIYGTEGTLSVPDPNTFGGPLKVRRAFGDWRELTIPTPSVPQERGIGLADMLSAQRVDRQHRASSDMALHVLELMSSALRSSEEGRRVDLTTSCERPEPLQTGLAPNTFD
jgi:predicted dehydrogenase